MLIWQLINQNFLSHYYEGRLRPRTAYAFRMDILVERLASKMPGIANFILHAPVISNIAKALAGIASKKKNAEISLQVTFKEWFSNAVRNKKHQQRNQTQKLFSGQIHSTIIFYRKH